MNVVDYRTIGHRFSRAVAIVRGEFADIESEILDGRWPQHIGPYPISIDARIMDALKAADLTIADLHIPRDPEKNGTDG